MYDIDYEVTRISDMEEFKKHIKALYVIDEYASSKERYQAFKEEMTLLCIGSFHSGEMMTYPISFKFYKDDKETFQLEFRAFLYNIYLWFTMVELKGIKAFNKESILVPEKIADINDEIYHISLAPLMENSVNRTKVQKYAADIVYDLSSISVYFGLIMGLHFSDTTFFEMYDNYGDLLVPKDYSNMQPDEIEAENSRMEHELIHRILNDPDNPFHQIIAGGNPLKIKQLRELLMTVSLRPSLENSVVTRPINNGLIMGALKSPGDVYIDGLAARKPALVNNKDMGDIGYFTKALDTLARTLEVSSLTLDCGSTHYVNYEVKTKGHLKLLAGKYMQDGDDLRVIKPTDKHLIGKKIPVRSVTTCCCGENEACPTCIGGLIDMNWDISEGFSVFVTEEWSKIVEQSKLSTKHLIHPIPEAILLSDSFSKWFELKGEEIYIKSDISNKKDLVIVIEPEEIYKVEEFDSDSTYNNYIDSGRFFIENTKTNESVEVSSKNKKFFICMDTLDIMKDGRIPMKELTDDNPVFEISINNNDATRPFTEIMQILDLENKPATSYMDPDKIIDYDDIDQISQVLLDLFVEAGIKLNIASVECMLNRICRQPDDVSLRPDFSTEKMPPHHFYSLGKCIEENASPAVGMIYEQLQRQLTRSDLEERNAASYIDPFFEEQVYTSPLTTQLDDEDEEEE